MAILQLEGSPYGEIQSREVTTNGAARPVEFSDEAALKTVVQDAAQAEMWLDQHNWSLGWRESDVLYQSPRAMASWENSSTTRANVSRFTVAKVVNSLVPTMMSGIFYDNPPFKLRPRPSTTEESVRAWEALLSVLLTEMDFKSECESFLESLVLNGTGIAKWGWSVETKVQKKFKRKAAPLKMVLPLGGEQTVHTAASDEFEVEEREVTKSRPFFEFKPLGTILIDPGWRKANQVWKARYVIERAYVTFEDLNRLREQKDYDIPSEEELKSLFFAPAEVAQAPSNTELSQQSNMSVHHAARRDERISADPLLAPLELLERWDGNRVMAVLNGKKVIRNKAHGCGRICYLSANWWNIQNAGYGMGIGRLIGADQRVEQGTMNASLDILSMAVNPQYARSRGANVPTQQIRSRLGGIVDVDGDVDKAFKLIEVPKVPPEAWQAIQLAKQSSEATSGADEALNQGSIPGKGSSIVRTATGAGGVIAANAARIQGPVGRFVDNVFIPFLMHVVEMVKERMPLSEVRAILGDEMTEAAELDFDNFLNANMKYEVLAGAHLAAKKAMAQALPFMVQIFENPHMIDSLNKTGWTVDLRELFEMMLEMSEWKNTREIIRRMSDNEQQMYQAAQNPMAGKVAGDIAKIQAKHSATQQEIDQKAEARTAEKLLVSSTDRATAYVERVVAERAMEPYVLGEGAHGEAGQYHTAAQ